MVFDLRLFRWRITFAFGGDYVQQLRTWQVFHRAQRLQQLRQVVTIDRAGVVKAKILEHGARHGYIGRRRATCHTRQRADVFADRHAVIVEHHQHVRTDIAAVIQGFERHAGGHCAIADHGNEFTLIAFTLRRNGHAERGGNRCGRMTDAKGVVLAFLAAGKRRQAVFLLDGGDAVAAAGKNLVRIALMPHVPDQPIVRRIEHVVQRHGEFHHAKARAKVAAGAGHRLDQITAQFIGNEGKLVVRNAPQVCRVVDGRQVRIAGQIDHLRIVGLASKRGKGRHGARSCPCHGKSPAQTEA